ncbi:MAG TPA: hypothetical protein VMR95_01110 [Candidatus Binatia bacterium]|nr:hypothetical protein [Candidatus Binatia bacterium]
MYPQRLPIVNSDDGTWGNILVQYLQLQHTNTGTNVATNGGHQNVTITAGTTTAAPLTLTSGTSLTTPAAGSLEFTTDTLYFTITTGTARETVAMYNDSSGALGTIHYRNSSSGPLLSLPIGSAGQYLGVSSGAPAWSNLTYTTNTVGSTTYTITTSNCIVLANAASNNVAITLPLASSCTGYQFDVKRIDSSANTCSVTCSGSDTIDGQASISIPTQYLSMTLISNGSAWYII